MRGAIGVAFEGDRRHGDDRPAGEPLLQVLQFWLAFGQSQPPAVIVDHEPDVIGLSKDAALRSNVAASKSHLAKLSAR